MRKFSIAELAARRCKSQDVANKMTREVLAKRRAEEVQQRTEDVRRRLRMEEDGGYAQKLLTTENSRLRVTG